MSEEEALLLRHALVSARDPSGHSAVSAAAPAATTAGRNDRHLRMLAAAGSHA